MKLYSDHVQCGEFGISSCLLTTIKTKQKTGRNWENLACFASLLLHLFFQLSCSRTLSICFSWTRSPNSYLSPSTPSLRDAFSISLTKTENEDETEVRADHVHEALECLRRVLETERHSGALK